MSASAAEAFWDKARGKSGPAPERGAPFFQAVDWPKCGSSEISLWEALHLAGRAMHGDEWTEQTMAARDWPISPTEQDRRSTENNTRFIAQPRPPARVRGGQVVRAEPEPNPLSREELARIGAEVAKRRKERLSEEQSAWDKNQVQLKRIADTMAWLHERFRFAEIETYSVFMTGAFDPLPIPKGDWYVSDAIAAQRFRHGGYTRIFMPSAQSFDILVFVDKASLESRIATLAHAPALVTGTDLGALSPYLRFAVAFALQHGASVDEWSREAVEQSIKEAWDKANPDDVMSPKMSERMAYVVRKHDKEAVAAAQAAAARRKKGGTP